MKNLHKADKNELSLRFVLGPDGKVYFDLSGSAPGQAVEMPAVRVDFEKLLPELGGKLGGTVPDDLPIQVELMLGKRLAQSLNMAKKTGAVSLGFEKTMRTVQKGQARLLIVATDAGDDVKKRLLSLKKGGYNLINWGANAQLASIFGVAACSVVCLKEGVATKQVAELLKKLQAFTG